MLKSYLLVALRMLRRRPGTAAINVVGLAVGLGCCLLIGLFVRDEWSYDRFHEKADRLFFVARSDVFGGERSTGTATPLPLARALEADLAGVEKAATTWGRSVPIGRPGEETEYGVLFADSTFFEMFTFPLVRGDAATALDEPNAAVISASMARALFGEADPLGQTLETDVSDEPTPLTVTGVMADPPRTSYFAFDAVVSLGALREAGFSDDWRASMYQTFALLAPGTSEDAVRGGLDALVDTHLGEDSETRYELVPLTDLYLSDLTPDDGFHGSTRYLLIFGSIALFILLVAVINYMNLATARAAQRVREVGVRKTLGATRGAVARQFLVEAVLVTAAALALGVVLAGLALPLFNGVFEKELSLSVVWTPGALLVGVALVVGVGLAAGSYPALYLSGFRPTRLLQHEAGGRGGAARLRRALVVMQFGVTIVLLVATAVVYRQLRFVQERDLGFAGEQVLWLRFADDAMANNHEAVKQVALAIPGVEHATAGDGVPGHYGKQYGFAPNPDEPDREVAVYTIQGDADYLETLGINLVAGRALDAGRPADETGAFLLNETAANLLAEDTGVGRTLVGMKPEGNEVVGIVHDYHFRSLREPIAPLLLRIREPGERPWPDYSALLVRFRPEQARRVTAGLADVWAQFGAAKPPDIEFLDDTFAEMYATDRRLGQVFGVFAGVAVVIACLGLLGLAAFAAEQRTKEIGIRKVLGASVANLVALLSREFLWLVLAAFAVAVPLAWLGMSRWLDGFAYRIALGPGLFLGAGAAALLLALATVGWQALRAATADPVRSLRHE